MCSLTNREPIFLLGAALVGHEQERDLRHAWDALRANIRDALLNDPATRDRYRREHGEGLPDVQASGLYQSQGYYRILRPSDPDYWRRNRAWLHEALRLTRTHEVKFLCVWTQLEDQVTPTALVDTLRPYTRGEAAAQRLARTLTNPYLQLIPPLLHRLYRAALQRERTVGIVWDDDHDSRGFQNLGVYQALQAQGHFKRTTQPSFSDVRQEPLLGLADVLGYVAGRYLYGVLTEQVPPDIEDWWHTYVQPSLLAVDVTDDREAEWALTVDLALAQHGLAVVEPSERENLRQQLVRGIDSIQAHGDFPGTR
ncbi:hypothetical protein V3W47_14170 [Deinococcus sp. YIM 134068]|uniref:hypothetical protein n=1 Tax=Deinococcus lichenicola TaxID=3118910 RepID=UPI002F934837